MGWVLVHGLCDDGLEPARSLNPKRFEWLRLGVQHRVNELRHTFARKRRHASDELVKDGTQRPDVCATVQVLVGTELLGRHVQRRSHKGRRARELAPRTVVGLQLGNAEIEHLEQWSAALTAGKEEVLRLEIPVHDAQAMGFLDAQTGLTYEPRRFCRGQPSAGGELLPEVLALEVFHGQVGRAVAQGARVKHATHMFVADACRRSRLALEALRGRWIALCQPGLQQLHGHALVEASVEREQNASHTALAQHALHAVLVGEHFPFSGQSVGRHDTYGLWIAATLPALRSSSSPARSRGRFRWKGRRL
ncbi:MAG: hypothetical protein RL385_1728 [Pseudomonadota bacterium]